MIAGGVIYYARNIRFDVLMDAEQDVTVSSRPGSVVDDNTNDNDLENSAVDMSDWQTYRNEEYGFRFQYPERFQLVELENRLDLYDKNHYSLSKEERSLLEVPLIPYATVYLYVYDRSKVNIIDWREQERILRKVMAPNYSESYLETFFEYSGHRIIEGINFNIFTHDGGLDLQGNFVTYHPKIKRLFGIETIIKSKDSSIISDDDVKKIVESVTFLDS